MDVSSGRGIIKVEQYAPSSYPFSLEFDVDTAVAIEAVPSFGHVFDGWSGDLSDTTNPAILLMDCDKNITASFSINWLLVGAAIGSLVIVVALVWVLIAKLIRRRALAGRP